MTARGRNRGLHAALVVFALIAIHLLYSFFAVGASLASMQRSAQGLRTGRADVAELQTTAREMLVAGRSAEAAANGIGPALASLVPGLKKDVGVMRFAANASTEGAEFARDAIDDLAAIAGENERLAKAFYRDGRIDFATVGELALIAQRTERFLDGLLRDQRAEPEPNLKAIAKLDSRLERTLGSARAGVARARLLLNVLPQLAGEGASRSYLLALQSPSEARGSGGIIGVYGILRATDGRLELAHVGPVLELGKKVRREVDAPGWYKDLYADLLALKEIRHVNLGLHFPTVAQILLDYYEQAKHQRLDGVIALDPIVLEQIATGTRPLHGPGWDVAVTSKNARRILMHDSYLKFGRFHAKDQNRFLQGVVTDLMDQLNGGRVNATAILLGLAKAAKWQHLKLYSTDPDLETSLGELKIDGDYSHLGPNIQSVFHNNFTGSKVDYFLHRHQHTQVEIGSDDTAHVTTSVVMDNQAPTEPSSLLIRPLLRRLPNGHNRMILSFLLPRGSESIGMSIGGHTIDPFRGNEGAYPVVWNIVDVPPGESVQAMVTYEIPDALDHDFSMTLWPQALVRPDTFTFELSASDGDIVDVTPRRRLHDGRYVLSGRLFGPKEITARVDP